MIALKLKRGKKLGFERIVSDLGGCSSHLTREPSEVAIMVSSSNSTERGLPKDKC
jgi:hypothetical protein